MVSDVLTAINAKLDSFAALEPDWNSYTARPIDARAIAAARDFLARLYAEAPARWPAPHVAPVPNGSVQVAWDQPDLHIEMEFGGDGGLEWYVEHREVALPNKNKNYGHQIAVMMSWLDRMARR